MSRETWKNGMEGFGKKASPRAISIYRWVFNFTMRHGYQPTMREIGDHFGISSPNAVLTHVAALAKYGYICPKEVPGNSNSGSKARGMHFLKTPDGEPFRGFIHKPE